MTELFLPSELGVSVKLVALCRTCGHYHKITSGPQAMLAQISEWDCKHQGHEVEFLSPQRFLPAGLDDREWEKTGVAPWWANFLPNANIKAAYNAAANLTIGLATGPLASDANLLAGRQSTVIDNTSNLFLDYQISGFVCTGTSPTAGQIEVWAFGQIDDSGTYPDTLGALDANVTITSVTAGSGGTLTIKQQGLSLISTMGTGTSSNIKYPFATMSVAALFGGGAPPNKWGVFVVHNTVAALNGTAANHQITSRGLYSTAV